MNNFTRLEPSLHLLDVPFDTQVVREREREGGKERGEGLHVVYSIYMYNGESKYY